DVDAGAEAGPDHDGPERPVAHWATIFDGGHEQAALSSVSLACGSLNSPRRGRPRPPTARRPHGGGGWRRTARRWCRPSSVTPTTGDGAAVRLTARTSMPKGSARAATPPPIEPRPTTPSVFPSSVPWSVAQPQCSGGSRDHDCGSRFSNASIAARTYSEIGTALAPREHVTTRPSNTS